MDFSEVHKLSTRAGEGPNFELHGLGGIFWFFLALRTTKIPLYLIYR
jgi:hypothetical protein